MNQKWSVLALLLAAAPLQAAQSGAFPDLPGSIDRTDPSQAPEPDFPVPVESVQQEKGETKGWTLSPEQLDHLRELAVAAEQQSKPLVPATDPQGNDVYLMDYTLDHRPSLERALTPDGSSLKIVFEPKPQNVLKLKTIILTRAMTIIKSPHHLPYGYEWIHFTVDNENGKVLRATTEVIASEGVPMDDRLAGRHRDAFDREVDYWMSVKP